MDSRFEGLHEVVGVVADGFVHSVINHSIVIAKGNFHPYNRGPFSGLLCELCAKEVNLEIIKPILLDFGLEEVNLVLIL